MYRLTAKNISLVFPLYGNRPAVPKTQDTDQDNRDNRLIISPSGTVVGVNALNGVNLDLVSGNRLGIVGVNGSGKTTLLQVLAGILTPDAGEISVQGHRSNLISIGLGLKQEATGRRNIFLSALAAGHSPKEIAKRRGEIEAFSELGDFLDMPVSTYSAGMRMRLSFAIATAFDPEILILDEWLSAGDAHFRAVATQRMKDFVGSAGILVFASHNPTLLQQNCNLGLWIHQGRTRSFGPIDEIVAEYYDFAKRNNVYGADDLDE